MNRARVLAPLLALALTAAAETEIGGRIAALPSPVWLDGQSRTLARMKGDRKFTVLYLWTPNQAALADFSRIAGIAEKFGKDAAFVGIAVGTEERLKRFPGAVRLGFPINVDSRGAMLETAGVAAERLPLALVLNKENTLLWQGRSAALPGVLAQCLAGTFDLKEEIRKHRFSRAVNTAVREGKFADAADLLHGEWEKSPDSIELLEAQLALLVRKLNRMDDALKLVHEAQRKNPGRHRFFEAEYKLLNQPGREAGLPEFFTRVRKEFADQPGVLMAFAVAEMGRPVETLNPARVLELADAGWRSSGFKDRTERGMFAIEYAKIVHAVGRTDLAKQLAQTAYSCFAGDAKRQDGAKQALLYYGKLLVAAPRIQVPDLQK
ncbi:MAG: hypothetical protein MR051_08330 [Lentisphaeria bacterium]|nr:hypothetical protein [Lentisphaeria bacterium]